MPFINKEHRERPDYSIPGDRCYIAYDRMMKEWTASPRWATVDALAELIWKEPWERAFALAFLVWFALVVMPYELKKREENGDIK